MTYDFAPLREDAARFLTERTGVNYVGVNFDNWLCCTARDVLGPEDYWPIMGVLVMEQQLWFEWYLTTAIADPRCLNRRILRALFHAVFDHCGAVRVTAEVDPDNRQALKQMKRLGFVYEGYRRMGVEGVRDGMMFGMLRADCPWLPGYSGGTILPQPTEVQHGLHS